MKKKIYIVITIFFFILSNSFLKNAHATFLESGDTISTGNYEVNIFNTGNQH